MLYEPPPATLFTGVGALSAVAAPAATAAFSGAGVLSSVGAPVPSAGFSGEGELLVAQNESVVQFTGAGVLSATAVPVATAAFTSAGALGAAASPSLTAGFTGSGSLSASAYAAATAGFTGSGALSAPAVSFRPSGMIRTGAESARFSTGETQITGWSADTTNYPGSSVVSDELIAQTGGNNVTVTANIEFRNASTGSRTLTLRIYVVGNATPVATSGAVSMSIGAIQFISATATGLTLANLASVRVTAQPSNLNSIVATANTASYVRILQP